MFLPGAENKEMEIEVLLECRTHTDVYMKNHFLVSSKIPIPPISKPLIPVL